MAWLPNDRRSTLQWTGIRELASGCGPASRLWSCNGWSRSACRSWPATWRYAPLPIGFIAVITGALGGVAIVVWWLFFSRAPWSERLGALLLMIAALFATRSVVHESIAGAGMGMLLYISSIPYLSLAFVAWALASRNFSDGVRRAALVGALVIACAPWAFLRTSGVRGGAGSEFHWRWTATPEERLLARAADEPLESLGEPKASPSQVAEAEIRRTPAARGDEAPLAPSRDTADDSVPTKPLTHPEASTAAKAGTSTRPSIGAPEWPGFRGPERNSIIRGVRIKTDWSASPPIEMWRRPIGPGWSSFAVRGDLLYTQEQRGEEETVTCYKVSTGKPVWRHRDPVRFWESNAGAGPRATPTLHQDRLYTFGATGILNALEAGSGQSAWSRNVASDTAEKFPTGASPVRRWLSTMWSSLLRPARWPPTTRRAAIADGSVVDSLAATARHIERRSTACCRSSC